MGLIVLCLSVQETKWQSRDGPSQVLLPWAMGHLHLLNQALGCSTGMTWSPGLHRGCIGCHRHGCRGNLWDSWHGGDSCGLWLQSHRCCGCNWHRLCQLCRLWCRDVRSGRSLQCGCCGVWNSFSWLDTVFTKVSSHVAVDHTIAGVYLVAVLGRMHTTVVGIQILWRVSYMAMGWPAYRGARDLHHLSACDLKALEQVAICSWTCRAAGSVFWILAGMVVLSCHWYRSSAGERRLALIGVALSSRRVSCRLAPLHLAHWSACFTDFTHASANPFDCW